MSMLSCLPSTNYQGRSASYYPLKKGIGLKLFHSKYTAFSSFKINQTLQDFNLASKVYSQVHKFKSSSRFDNRIVEQYGYIVEHCKELTIFPYKFKTLIRPQLVKEIYEITGLYCVDAHIGNWGINKDNKIVLIDTEEYAFIRGYSESQFQESFEEAYPEYS